MQNETSDVNLTFFYVQSSPSNFSSPGYFSNNLYNSLVGSAIFFAVFPFLICRFRFFPIETSYFVLIGAMLMLWSNVVSPSEFFEIVGRREYISGLLLALGTTIIGDYFAREQFFSRAVRQLLKEDHTFSNYLLRISCISFVVSMIFSSDLNCLIVTPIILKCWEEQEKPRNELKTITLAIATSASLGGSASIFGNIALSFLAAKRENNLKICIQYLLLPAIVCFWLNYGFLLGLYSLRHKSCCNNRSQFVKNKVLGSGREIDGRQFSNTVSFTDSVFSDASENEGCNHANGSIYKDDKHFHPPTLETIIEDEILVLPETSPINKPDSSPSAMVVSMRLSSATEDLTNLDDDELTSSLSSDLASSQLSNTRNSQAHLIEYHNQRTPLILNWEANEPVVGFTMVNMLNASRGFHEVQGNQNTKQLVLRSFLLLVELLVIVLQFTSSFQPFLDPGLISFGGALAIVVADITMNKRSPLVSSHFSTTSYNWGLTFVGFFSLFVLVHGFNKTGIPSWLLNLLATHDTQFHGVNWVSFLLILTLITVNFLGFVPASLIFISLSSAAGHSSSSSPPPSSSSSLMGNYIISNLSPSLPDDTSLTFYSLQVMLFTTWMLSMSSMTSLMSSVTNSLVAQKSLEILKVRISYFHSFAYGLPASVLFSVVGVSIISLFLHVS